MRARLLRDQGGTVKLLHADGTISNSNETVLSNFLMNFKDVMDFSGTDGKWTSSCRDMSLYPGETLAYIADDMALVILDFSEFVVLLDKSYTLENYISLGEYAVKVDKSREILKVMCRSGRIPGAQKIANRWMIPKDAPYPIPAGRQRNDLKNRKH